ncbi:MAG: hypothetical protein GY748_18910 [Planctomycetaceae bacterium]|nr:hypothetical protein [Planctomycetaceae bacterium]MCP4479861.1 hypothetical protein [Planctomycetaceae bacterium]
MRNSPLPPKVIEYCQRCSKWEGTAIVAYCCYLSFTDRTIKAAEVITVNAIAEQFGISPAKTVWIGRKVRRGSLKIKRPQSSDARKLLFFLSLMLAGTDFEIDEREEKAIEALARKLRLPSEIAARQVAKFKNNKSTQPTDDTVERFSEEQSPPPHAQDAAAIFGQMNQTVTQTFVDCKWEAELFQIPHPTNAEPAAELEFTPHDADPPGLELSFFDTACNDSGKLTIRIGNRCAGGIQINSRESEYLISLEPATDWRRVIAGAVVTVNLDGHPILKGEFQLD